MPRRIGVVHAITIGISRREQLFENVRLVEELAPQCPLRRESRNTHAEEQSAILLA
jgi:hypothetical protein